MSARETKWGRIALRLYLAASAVTAVAAMVIALKRVPPPPRPDLAPLLIRLVRSPAEPIPAEAQVFRLRPDMLPIEPDAPRDRAAHPRTWALFRFLRAYPGAPPRIPHGLSPDEYRTDACKQCHERGGYSLRFAAYVPLTSHPDMGMCLQCHVGEDSVLGFADPDADPNTRCTQCHGPAGGPVRAEARLPWLATDWPPLAKLTPGQNPPPIPHDSRFRLMCVACHAGQAAVADIRTSHAEWSDCRQCHVAAGADVVAFAGHPGLDTTVGGSP
ncbi:MAG TPA: hypothetical protein VMG41_14395 [Gemmatimonadales bacterium]|nr:hypothetical protein [Gemmatimonadales bacterium]